MTRRSLRSPTSEYVTCIDTSVMVSLLSPDDSNHQEAKSWFINLLRLKSLLAASVVVEVELKRSLQRRSAPLELGRAANELLEMFERVDLTPEIRKVAAELTPPSTRSLDAIHVATALAAEADAFLTFDLRQRVAAEEANLATSLWD